MGQGVGNAVVFQPGAILPSRGHSAMSREISGCRNLGVGGRRRVLSVSNGWRPGRLLNILKHLTIQKIDPHKKELSDKNVSNVGVEEC